MQREAAQRVKQWATGKDLPSLLGTLAEFVADFPVFAPSAALGVEELVRSLRSKPEAATKAYRAACASLHPDRHTTAKPDTQVLALALLQALAVEHATYIRTAVGSQQQPTGPLMTAPSEGESCAVS